MKKSLLDEYKTELLKVEEEISKLKSRDIVLRNKKRNIEEKLEDKAWAAKTEELIIDNKSVLLEREEYANRIRDILSEIERGEYQGDRKAHKKKISLGIKI